MPKKKTPPPPSNKKEKKKEVKIEKEAEAGGEKNEVK